jgi:hypothetical protein
MPLLIEQLENEQLHVDVSRLLGCIDPHGSLAFRKNAGYVRKLL